MDFNSIVQFRIVQHHMIKVSVWFRNVPLACIIMWKLRKWKYLIWAYLKAIKLLTTVTKHVVCLSLNKTDKKNLCKFTDNVVQKTKISTATSCVSKEEIVSETFSTIHVHSLAWFSVLLPTVFRKHLHRWRLIALHNGLARSTAATVLSARWIWLLHLSWRHVSRL